MEELPRMIFGGAQLLLPKSFAKFSQNVDNDSSPSGRCLSARSAEYTPNKEMNSLTRNIKPGGKSPHWMQYQVQISPIIEEFIPKSTLMKILYLIFWPVTLFYLLYIYLPMKIWGYVQSLHVYKVSLEISLRKNELIR